MSKILEILSKPFVPSVYFVTNSQIFVGDSVAKLLSSMGDLVIKSYSLGNLSPLLQLDKNMYDSEIVPILYEKNNKKGVRVSFLDIAIHIEQRLQNKNNYGECEVLYVGRHDQEYKMYVISITDRNDGRLEIQAFNINESTDKNISRWKKGTFILAKG